MAKPPGLVQPIPALVMLEGAPFPEVTYNDYIVSYDEDDGPPHFLATLEGGAAMPKGLVCSDDGVLSGIPEVGTHGQYIIQLVVKNDADTPYQTSVPLTILERIEAKPGQPVLVGVIPAVVVNEGAALGPIDLRRYIRVAGPDDEKIHFVAELEDGASLPRGTICTSTGILSGIPASDTAGYFQVRLTVENPVTHAKLETQFALTIKERIEIGNDLQFYTGLKTQIWDALEKNQPVPEFAELFNRQLTAVEIYYLMQRFATLTIYDVYNLDPPSEPVLLTLPGASPHYNIYDRGSCLVGTPKELFSHARTPEDALITAKVMAREVYKRDWTIELVGFQKMMRASWVELQVLGEKQGKFLDVLHYTPTLRDVKLCETELELNLALGKSR
jgi:hypothetical protein